MKRKVIYLIVALILCFTPMEGKLRIRHVGPIKERTEQEQKKDQSTGLLFAIGFITLVAFIKLNKKKT